jgi:hypothetical protein
MDYEFDRLIRVDLILFLDPFVIEYCFFNFTLQQINLIFYIFNCFFLFYISILSCLRIGFRIF